MIIWSLNQTINEYSSKCYVVQKKENESIQSNLELIQLNIFKIFKEKPWNNQRFGLQVDCCDYCVWRLIFCVYVRDISKPLHVQAFRQLTLALSWSCCSSAAGKTGLQHISLLLRQTHSHVEINVCLFCFMFRERNCTCWASFWKSFPCKIKAYVAMYHQ